VKPGPPPQPLALRLLRGNTGKRRVPVERVKPTPGAPCPAQLSAAAKREWKRVTPELRRLGLLAQIDRAALAAYCEAWADFEWAIREARGGRRITTAGNGTRILHPAMIIKRQAMDKIRQFAAEFGFTPAARARIEIVGAEEEPDGDERFFGHPRPASAPKPPA